MKKLVALLLIGGFLLSGCTSTLLNRSYLSITPHQQHTTEEDGHSILTAENYAELLNCVQYFVTIGAESGTVRLYEYSGVLSVDLAAACAEVQNNDPLGAYALDDISYHNSRIVSYNECVFTYTYRRTAEQLQAIKSVSGTAAIRQQCVEAMRSFADELVLKTASYYAGTDNIRQLLEQAYQSNPLWAVGAPEVVITSYPETGDERIVEILFRWPDTQSTLTAEQAAAERKAEQLTESVQASQTGAEQLTKAFEAVTIGSGFNGSIYDALVLNHCSVEGAALAYGALCEKAWIPCLVVKGTLNGEIHWWNIVTLNGRSRHIDVAEGGTTVDGTDAVWSAQGYDWDRSVYPACMEG